MATLAVHDAGALRQALHDGDVAALADPGHPGQRGAERMVLELRDKIGAPAAPAAPILSRSSSTIRSAPR
ncbi:hypothetical protein JHV675_51070 [Mycobacterium avium subsp. hominissuis]